MTVKIYMTILFILLYFFFIFNVTGKKIKQFNCPCGVDRNNYPDDRSYKYEVKKAINAMQPGRGTMQSIGSDTEIRRMAPPGRPTSGQPETPPGQQPPGGKQPKFSVAWMAMLIITVEDDPTMKWCGAVLINSKFLLTAGHCLCHPQIKLRCELTDDAWIPTYNISNYITAQINIEPIATFKGKFMTKEWRIKKGIIHKKFLKSLNATEFEKNKDGPYDIAVVELMDRIDFNKMQSNETVQIMPICMPSKSFKDTGINATVSGYGIIDNKKEECITDATGPDVYTHCSRKYKKGKMAPNAYEEVCTVEKTPSNKNKLCKHFNHVQNKEMKLKEVILIPKNKQNDWDGRSELKGLPSEFSCFPIKGEFGWCKTCNNTAVRNTPGFCDPNVLDDTNDKHVPISTFDSGWGFCSKDCHRSMHNYSTVDVYILTEDQCKEMMKYYTGPKKNIDTMLHLCAGVKLNLFPVYYNYEKIVGEKGYHFSKIPSEKKPSSPKQKRIRKEYGVDLPFHIGGKESCGGNTAGPLWTTFNDKRYLVGLMSSENECTGINSPGIFCRVKYKLNWIYKWAKTGACNNNRRKKKKKMLKKNKEKKKKRKKKKMKKRGR